MLGKKILTALIIAGLMFTVSAKSHAASTSLVINELFYFTDDGGAGDTGQWLELRNLSATESIDLSTTTLTVETSSSTVWQGGTALSYDISLSHIIAPGEYFLISNTAANLGLGSSFVYADYVVSDIPFLRRGVGSVNTSTRGVRIKLDGTIIDSVLYGRTDGASVNTQQLDVDGYFVLNPPAGPPPTNPSEVSILAGTAQGNSLGRDPIAPIDTDQLSDWELLATPSPEAGNAAVPEPSVVFLFLAGVIYFKRRFKNM